MIGGNETRSGCAILPSPPVTGSGLDIIYEDNHLLVINKPSGMLVQADRSADASLEQLAKEYIRVSKQKPGEAFIGVPHRIDRPTSGIVCLAKTSKALVRLNAMFAERKMKKVYWAIVTAKPPKEADRLIHFLRKNEETNLTRAFANEAKHTKRSELTYELLGASDRYFLVEVHPLTGRHHQIRAQLAFIGCPIKGDLKYGAARSNPDGSICLHARRLSMEHPTTKERMEFTAPVPNDALWRHFAGKEG